MKTIILFALLVLAVSCQKEQVNQTKQIPIQELPILNPCVELDTAKFIGKWMYKSFINRNDQFQQVFPITASRYILIDRDSSRSIAFPKLPNKWYNIGCSVVRNLSVVEDIKVSFFGNDMMTFEGLTTGTIWTLTR